MCCVGNKILRPHSYVTNQQPCALLPLRIIIVTGTGNSSSLMHILNCSGLTLAGAFLCSIKWLWLTAHIVTVRLTTMKQGFDICIARFLWNILPSPQFHCWALPVGHAEKHYLSRTKVDKPREHFWPDVRGRAFIYRSSGEYTRINLVSQPWPSTRHIGRTHQVAGARIDSQSRHRIAQSEAPKYE